MCTILYYTVALLLGVQLTSAGIPYISDKSDFSGPYCATRSTPCCSSRNDSCSVPIQTTRCYCDDFCYQHSSNRTEDDCCPDYIYVCLNQPRPSSPPPNPIQRDCFHQGRNYNEGESLKENCNQCKCERVCEGSTRPSCRVEMVCTQHRCLVDPQLIQQINQDNVGWRAANYSVFWGHTLDEGFARRLGTKHSTRKAYTMRPINAIFDRDRVRAKVRFDPRIERPGQVSLPQDQGWCAADWVISTVQVATDRLAIASKGEDRTALSPQHLLSCNSKNQRGCDGGHITRAWKFIQRFGLVPEACYPWVGVQTNCSVSKLKDKTRVTARCASGNEFMPLHRTGPPYRVSPEPETIMNEILTVGPVQASMKVSQDFFSYRNGIYRCSRPGSTYHSVRIIGWGEEIYQGKLVKYWIVSNSWGTWWGESGYFRIRRGINECDIESLVLGTWITPIFPKKDPYIPMMDNSISNTLYRSG